jgi:hypothetical protein
VHEYHTGQCADAQRCRGSSPEADPPTGAQSLLTEGKPEEAFDYVVAALAAVL